MQFPLILFCKKFWSWDIYTDTCAICRNALHGPSIEYQVSRSNMSLVFQLFIFYTTKNIDSNRTKSTKFTEDIISYASTDSEEELDIRGN